MHGNFYAPFETAPGSMCVATSGHLINHAIGEDWWTRLRASIKKKLGNANSLTMRNGIHSTRHFGIFFFFFCGGFSPFINAIDNVVGHRLVVFMVQPVHRLDSLPVVIGVTFWLVPVVHSCNWKAPFFNSQFNVKLTEKQFICYFLKLTR